jgi:hypothetical protein
MDRRIFCTPQHTDSLWSPSILLVSGYGRLSSGVKWPGCEAPYSLRSTAEVKEVGAITPFHVRLHNLMLNI